MGKITAFTDGSAIVKGERLGGVGVYLTEGNNEHFISKGYKNTTISRMEMRALLYAIKKVPIGVRTHLQVYSDSQFVVNSFIKGWLDNWKKENFLGRTNSDLWKEIVEAIDQRSNMKFKITHTRGHLKDLNDPIVYGNNVADLLANYKNFNEYEDDRH